METWFAVLVRRLVIIASGMREASDMGSLRGQSLFPEDKHEPQGAAGAS